MGVSPPFLHLFLVATLAQMIRYNHFCWTFCLHFAYAWLRKSRLIMGEKIILMWEKENKYKDKISDFSIFIRVSSVDDQLGFWIALFSLLWIHSYWNIMLLSSHKLHKKGEEIILFLSHSLVLLKFISQILSLHFI